MRKVIFRFAGNSLSWYIWFAAFSVIYRYAQNGPVPFVIALIRCTALVFITFFSLFWLFFNVDSINFYKWFYKKER